MKPPGSAQPEAQSDYHCGHRGSTTNLLWVLETEKGDTGSTVALQIGLTNGTVKVLNDDPPWKGKYPYC